MHDPPGPVRSRVDGMPSAPPPGSSVLGTPRGGAGLGGTFSESVPGTQRGGYVPRTPRGDGRDAAGGLESPTASPGPSPRVALIPSGESLAATLAEKSRVRDEKRSAARAKEQNALRGAEAAERTAEAKDKKEVGLGNYCPPRHRHLTRNSRPRCL
jgi:hypothetical protein